jgi:hypothetical protein
MKNDQRKEARKVIDTISLPFLGSKEEDHLCFEYMLVDLSKNGLRIAIPKWVVNREQIKKDDTVNFHLPYEIDKIFYDQGKVVWTKWDDSMEAQVCGVSIENSKPIPYPYPEPSSQKENTLTRLIKDSMLLKKGVYIYLGHIIPYFSRITDYSRQEYPQLKAVFLEDVRSKVGEHCTELEKIFTKLKNKMLSVSEISKFIDLEGLRSIIESEIYLEVFKITFSDEHIMPYLNAIKKLEDKLYFNYNIIVMLYVNSL